MSEAPRVPNADSTAAPSGAPSAAQNARTLRGMELAHALPDTYWRLLRAHYRAPDHTATATELAGAVGFAAYGAVNLHYGTFGAKLADRLGWRVPDGQPQASAVATFEGGPTDAPDTRWVLRPEVAAALEQLGWAPPRPARQPQRPDPRLPTVPLSHVARTPYVRTEHPAFSWSHSRQQALDACERRYFWQYYHGHNGWEDDAPPRARAAWALKKLTTYPQALGTALHDQARRAGHAARARRPAPDEHTLRESVRGALNRLYLRSKDRAAFVASPARHVITTDAYYGREAPPDLFERLREKLGRCVSNLLDQPVWDELAALPPANIRVLDEVDVVSVDGVTVYVAPDLVFRTPRDGWVVLDWKSGAGDDVEAQLALYALYLRDGLGLPARFGGYQGRVVHLESGRTTVYDILPDDLEAARARVADGVRRMHAFLADVGANHAHPAHAFTMAADRRACRYCNYRELCEPEWDDGLATWADDALA